VEGTEIPTKSASTEPKPKPLAKRVLQFPLVALILAFLLMVLAQGLAAGVSYLAGNRGDGFATPADLLFALVVTVLTVLAYKLLVVRMGEEPRDDLPFDGRARDAASGFLQGALVFSAIVGIAALLGAYQVIGLSPAEDWLPILVATGLMAGVTEEILLRGIVFRWLEELGGSWVALALSALLFGFLHAANPNATLISSLSIALAAGVLLGGAYMLSRNLWQAIGLHAGWNVTQGLVWDVPVSGVALDGWVESRLVGDPILSGGSFGLEASVVTMVVATAYGVWLIVRAARRGNVVRNRWARRRLASDEAVRVDVDADAHPLREA
jgi:membrane protease YdiL (CAAX protease family)